VTLNFISKEEMWNLTVRTDTHSRELISLLDMFCVTHWSTSRSRALTFGPLEII